LDAAGVTAWGSAGLTAFSGSRGRLPLGYNTFRTNRFLKNVDRLFVR
jgi:hypothetical protein